MARFTVDSVRFVERPVTFRMPFRFGVVTMTEAPQLFVCTRITLADGRSATGVSANILAPKWFDKDVALSNEENFAQLRRAVRAAADAYLSETKPLTAWAYFAGHYQSLIDAANSNGSNALVASFGPAALDASLLDALGRALNLSFYDLVKRNIPAIAPAELAPDLAEFDFNNWLRTLKPANRIAARHTVGLVDTISGHLNQVGDGLPESLSEVIATYGHRHFKVKVGGDVVADIDRLLEIAAVTDTLAEDYLVSLDGNEQYDHVEQVVELWRRVLEQPRLRRFADAVCFIEQPIARKYALAKSIDSLATVRPVIIDESDDSFDAFPRAVALGYRGVSSKLCKGLYKSMINAARCEDLRSQAGASSAGPFIMSGEDLTTQAGIAVQQDLALANLLGIEHIERNGHHYVNGMAGATASEQQAFFSAHPDLYEMSDGVARLKIANGLLQLSSLSCPGFGSATHPNLQT